MEEFDIIEDIVYYVEENSINDKDISSGNEGKRYEYVSKHTMLIFH